MKILVVGDFHGEFPNSQLIRLRNENPDLVFSPGDFCGSLEWAKLFFKYFYAKNNEECENIPEKIKAKLENFENVAIERGIEVLRKLKKLKKPFFAVHGNWDPSKYGADIGRRVDEKYSPSVLKKFHKIEGKTFSFIDFKIKDFGDFVLVGGTSTTHPGKIDKKSLNVSLKKKNVEDKKEIKEIIRVKKRQSEWRKRKYILAFQKAKMLKKPIVFLTHNCPYGTRLDLIRDKKADKLARGKHYGSYLERLMINRFKPDLVLCGHMHENFGKQKLGKTLVVNSGAVFQGEYVLINFNKETKKFKVELKKI